MILLILLLGTVLAVVSALIYGAKYYDRELIKAGTAYYNVSQALAKALAEMTDLKEEIETYKKLAEAEKLNHELCHKEPWGRRTCDLGFSRLKPTAIRPGFVKKGGVNTPPKNPRPRTPTPKK